MVKTGTKRSALVDPPADRSSVSAGTTLALLEPARNLKLKDENRDCGVLSASF